MPLTFKSEKDYAAWYAAHPNIRRGKASDLPAPVADASASSQQATGTTETGESGSGRNIRVPTSVPSFAGHLASARRKIFVTLALSFLLQVIAQKQFNPAKVGKEGLSGHIRPGLKQINIVGWGILAITLVAMADFETTADLATSFAFLILIVAFAMNGEAAAKNIGILSAINTPAKQAKPVTNNPAVP